MRPGLLALFVLVVAVACGGGSAAGSPSPSPSPVKIGPLVLTDSGCAWQGPAQMNAGPVSIQMVDQAKGGFALDLWLLDKSHSYDELVSHIKEEQRRFAAHEPELGHPTFASLVAQRQVVAGATGNVDVTLTAGTYGFVCIPLSGNAPAGIYLAGPMRVP